MVARRRRGSVGGGSLLNRMINRPATNATTTALMWGIAWLIIGSIVAWYFRLEPTSMFGYVASGYIPLWRMTLLHVVIWVVSTIIPYIFAVLRNRGVSTMEFFGRMLFAHWPVTLLMIPALTTDISRRVAYSTYMNDVSLCFEQAPIFATLMTIICAIVLVWWLYWSYRAFSYAQRRGGVLTLLSYIVSMALSFPLTRMVLEAIH